MVHGHRWPIGTLLMVALAVALILVTPMARDSLAYGTTIYVDADATGDSNGTSWGHAYPDLQDGLAAAVAGTEIWVAAGTYKPTSGTDRTASFQMKNGVAIYGGFDPSVGDTAFEDRDWEANETILSGDLNGDDGDNFANNGENSYHVFYHDVLFLDHTAVLDGFTVSGGNANGGSRSEGGGMFNLLSWPALTNVTFSGNSAFRGGGIYHEVTLPALMVNCTFSLNRAEGTELYQGRGGGMYNDESSPELTDCTFEGNTADVAGGGMFNDLSSPTLTGCTFSGNSADVSGGGMFNDSSSPTLINLIFSQNEAYGSGSGVVGGGGVFNDNDSSPALTGCTFSDNSADENGGGMFNDSGSSPVLTDCSFAGNSAAVSGGGMHNNSSSPSLTDCSFQGNMAEVSGGGMFNESSPSTLVNVIFSQNEAHGRTGGWSGGGGLYDHLSPSTLNNCTFWGNSAPWGGGMLNVQSWPALTNCILWGNYPHQIWDVDPWAMEVRYSDVQGGYIGLGNIDADPLFLDPSDGDFHLQPGSPCIDAGNNAPTYLPLPSYDFEGDARIIDGNGDGVAVVDMGVDEVLLRIYLPLVLRGY